MENDTIDENMIECSFLQIKQYGNMAKGETDEMRSGRYSGSMYSVQDYGLKRWVVLGYLVADYKLHREQGLKDQEIIKKCLNYLNTPEARKKYQKKDSVPKYGNLQILNENNLKFLMKEGQEVATLQLIIDQRRNENFWGEGEKF
jgi:hypothetical protein